MMNIANAVGSFPRAFLIAFFVISIDQFSKLFARMYVNHTLNTGTVFGLFSDNNVWFVLLTFILVALFFFQQELLHFPLSFGLILGGALGNVIDRISLGGVIDFITIGPFPSFNLADSALTLGVILLLWNLFKEKIPTIKKEKKEAA